jgi:hypothetical protein
MAGTPTQRGLLKRAILYGTIVALGLFVASEVAFETGHGRLARLLEWQASLLQSTVPTPTFGTKENPIYEGTPLHIFAWYVGVVLSIPMYSAIAYAALALRRRGRAL